MDFWIRKTDCWIRKCRIRKKKCQILMEKESEPGIVEPWSELIGGSKNLNCRWIFGFAKTDCWIRKCRIRNEECRIRKEMRCGTMQSGP